MRKLFNKTLSVALSVAMLTAAFAAAKVAHAQDGDTVSYFNLRSALASPKAKQGVMNLKYCLYGNIDKALKLGMRSKSDIAATVAPVCYQQLAVPLQQQHLTNMSNAQIERVVESITYDLIDQVAAQETGQ